MLHDGISERMPVVTICLLSQIALPSLCLSLSVCWPWAAVPQQRMWHMSVTTGLCMTVSHGLSPEQQLMQMCHNVSRAA